MNRVFKAISVFAVIASGWILIVNGQDQEDFGYNRAACESKAASLIVFGKYARCELRSDL